MNQLVLIAVYSAGVALTLFLTYSLGHSFGHRAGEANGARLKHSLLKQVEASARKNGAAEERKRYFDELSRQKQESRCPKTGRFTSSN